jgi:hypothetical protein
LVSSKLQKSTCKPEKKEEAAVKRKVMIKEERRNCCPEFKLLNTTV